MIKKLNIQIILLALFYILISFLDFYFRRKGILEHFINDTFIMLGVCFTLLYLAAVVVWKLAKYPIDRLLNLVVLFSMALYLLHFMLYGFKGYFSYGIFLMPYVILMLFIGIVIYHFVNAVFIKKLPKIGQIMGCLIVIFAIFYFNIFPLQDGKRMIGNVLSALLFLVFFIIYHVKVNGVNIRLLESAKA